MPPLAIPGIEAPEEIGRGARGIVYRARRQGQTVAVKVALDPRADLRETRQWFWREGAILACVNHPGLAEIIEVGEADGYPYLVREYVAGRTIAADLAGGPLPLERLVVSARMVAGALAQVHRHGLVHRDVKPQNIILLDHQMGAKLIDFGLATRFDREIPTEVAGTVLYSAPEQTGMLKRPVDGRADLYALGVVLFEAATGQLPFAGDEVGEIIRAHAVVKPPDLRQLHPGLPELLCLIIEKLLAKDPDDRYQTGDGLAADLERLHGPTPLLRLGERDQDAPTSFEPRWAGREEDLADILAVWSQVLQGRPCLTVIEGESGSGKSRLVRELFARIQDSSPLIVSARCVPGDPPLRALRDAAEQYLDRLQRLPADQAWGARLQLRLAASGSGPSLGRLSPRLAAGPEEPAGEEAPDRFYQAAADWFLRLADEHPAVVFYVDDMQWIDEASREVARRIILGIGQRPVLLLGCTRNDLESLKVTRDLLASAPGQPLRVQLAPLGEKAVGRLIASHLGGRNVAPELVQRLTVRTRGNPFFVGEYIRAMLEGGLLRPKGSEWHFEADGLERLELASDVLNLVLERLSDLSPPARSLLELAAVWGQRSFELAGLAEMAPAELDVAVLIGQALELRLLDRSDAGRYMFSHDRIREALLAGLEPERLSALHGRIAGYLEKRTGTEPEDIYALARHLALGQGSPERIYLTSREAGRVALEQFAFEQAYRYLAQAARSGHPRGAEAADLKEMLARVCLATNRLEEAAEHLAEALAETRDPLQRARLWEQRSWVHLSQYHISEANYDVQRAFAEIGRPARPFRPLRIAAGVARLLLFLALDRGRHPPATGAVRERLQIKVRLLEQTGYIHWFEHDLDGMFELGGRLLLAVRRLGPSRELVRAYAKVAYYGGILGSHWLVRRYVARGESLARELADPVALAHISLFHGLSLHQLGQAREAEAILRRQLEDPGRWLDALDFSLGCTALITSLLMRGYTSEALRWVERGLDRQHVSSGSQNPLEKLNLWAHRMCVHSFLGRHQEAAEQLKQVRSQLSEPERVRDLATNLYSFTIHMLAEQEEIGPRLEEAIARFEALRSRPHKIPLNRRHGFVFVAYARLGQLQAGEGSRLHFREALNQLHQAATAPFLRCHLLVLEAAWQRLLGRHPASLRQLAQAELIAAQIDSPWAMLEIAQERARVLASQGNRELSAHQAQLAVSLAEELGWAGRARRLRSELLPPPSLTSSAARASRSRESGKLARPERHLDALVQVSLASGSMLNPTRQAQVCLDEMIRLLGAERGFLFWLGREGALERLAARDATGQDLGDEGYSTTVIEQVRSTHQPLVVSGTDQGEVLGSQSVVALELRSILAAPLTARGQTLGIVYLDSRLARGVFSAGDIGITVALCNQVAITLEHARAASLEASLEAERRQRDLAESVRDLTTVLGSTLQFPEVLSHLLESLEKTVPHELGRALVPEGEDFSCVVERGALGTGVALPLTLLHELVSDPQPVRIVDVWRDTRFSAGSKTRAWLAVPVVYRGEVAVVIVLEHSVPGAFSESQADLALTFSAQAGVALENARLFAQVRTLASTDELTGLLNRRHFLELGRQEFSRAQRHGHPLSAVMLDVDHFKNVNDTYGHAAGDQVLRMVAQVCRDTLRGEDLIGRFGGEELAMVLPQTPPQRACQILAERLRAAIQAQRVTVGGAVVEVTASLGVAGLEPEDNDLTQLLSRADTALYAAKKAGRNRVVLS